MLAPILAPKIQPESTFLYSESFTELHEVKCMQYAALNMSKTPKASFTISFLGQCHVS